MDKKEMAKELNLYFIDDGRRMTLLVPVVRDIMLKQLKLLEKIEIFFNWYYGGRDEKCLYSKESLKQLADDILDNFSRADADFIKKHRNDYEVLEMVCRNNCWMGSFEIVETVKLMDYIIDNGLV
jgi:hypothetical protein